MNIHELSKNETILLILPDGLGVFSIVVTAIGHFLEVYFTCPTIVTPLKGTLQTPTETVAPASHASSNKHFGLSTSWNRSQESVSFHVISNREKQHQPTAQLPLWSPTSWSVKEAANIFTWACSYATTCGRAIAVAREVGHGGTISGWYGCMTVVFKRGSRHGVLG